MISFFGGEHAFWFVTPMKNVVSMSAFDTTLFQFLPYSLKVELLLMRMPLVPCEPFLKVLLSVLEPEEVYFVMRRDQKYVLRDLKIEGNRKRR